MDNIRFAENLLVLRKEKKITQEQLADFCGVTKASVSKWETGQTLPDVLLLPRLAAFFSISIDELLGYEIYLTKEQIHKIYEDLATGFATKEFDVAMMECRECVKQYYSCYELLEKIILLWISHEMLAGEKREELLAEAGKLCGHILENSRNISLCNDVVFLQAIVDLLQGHPSKVVEALEDMSNPCRLSIQSEEVLLSAYMELGMQEKGNDFAQITMYLHILSLISEACKFLELNRDNREKCEETKRRIEAIIKIYNLEVINFHYVTLFMYQMAEVYSYYGEKEKAIEQLTKYVEVFERFLNGQISYLQSDYYLDRLHIWFEKSVLSGNFPREKKTVYDGMLLALKAPAFDDLKGEDAFVALQKKAARCWKHNT
ncbi:MAG: helix-turn-helix transcriptional regulator [Lachnospiraceae bacterium]|nr:helix-turn-helix transcriptional regulator [Lachnospiraceae bacterium]